MELWNALNSPFVIAFMGLLWSSLVASRLTARWQMRSHDHVLRLTVLRELLEVYQQYIRFARRHNVEWDENYFNEIHPKFIATVKMASAIFPHKDIDAKLKLVVKRFGSVKQFKSQGQSKHLENSVKEIINDMGDVVHLMTITVRQQSQLAHLLLRLRLVNMLGVMRRRDEKIFGDSEIA